MGISSTIRKVVYAVGWALFWPLRLPQQHQNVPTSRVFRETASEANNRIVYLPALFFVQFVLMLVLQANGMPVVPSPVWVTVMQVSSIVVALAAFVLLKTTQSSEWGAALMVTTWALFDIPWCFLCISALWTGNAANKIPYELFWLRYFLFAFSWATDKNGKVNLVVDAAHATDNLLFGDPESLFNFCYARALPAVHGMGFLIMVCTAAASVANTFQEERV